MLTIFVYINKLMLHSCLFSPWGGGDCHEWCLGITTVTQPIPGRDIRGSVLAA